MGDDMVTRARDSFCSFCGTRFEQTATYPRTCRECGAQIWANPVPVAVALVPVIADGRTGLLVVRRAIPPIGKLALVGGFVEEHESWQACAARELHEEVGVAVEPSTLLPLWYASSEPKPDRVLLFAVAAPIEASSLGAFAANTEASERGVVFGCGEGDDTLAFPLHVEAARRYFGRVAPLEFQPL